MELNPERSNAIEAQKIHPLLWWGTVFYTKEEIYCNIAKERKIDLELGRRMAKKIKGWT